MTAPFETAAEPWRRARILFEDADVMVVDKPAGVSTLASERGGDDVVSRVRAFVARRDGTEVDSVYASAPKSLERDTSGVVVLTRRRSANAPLVQQVSRGELVQSFVLIVESGPRKDAGHLSAGAAQIAFRALARNGPRAKVEFGPVTLSSARLREVLAQAGVHLARSPCAHPLVHASSVSFRHPTTGATAVYRSPTPSVFDDALAGTPDAVLANDHRLDEALDEAALLRTALFADDGTDAFRLAHADGDALPHVTVDRYGDFALVQFYDLLDATTRERVLDAVARLGATGVYVKFRPKQANELVDTRRDDLAPAHPVRGAPAPDEFAMRENGLSYRVRLGDGLSTGIFLDQRDNRRRVREMARGARVLNLFAYTGAFGVAATAGGARHVTQVDVSSTALAWARRNLEANAFDPSHHALIVADVFGWLDGARARGDRFDLVLLDPPSYATTKEGTRFSAATDYRSLAATAFAVVAKGGTVLACSNHRGIVRAKLRRYLHEAAREAGREVARMRDLEAPGDFPPPEGREAHLKSVLVTLS